MKRPKNKEVKNKSGQNKKGCDTSLKLLLIGTAMSLIVKV